MTTFVLIPGAGGAGEIYWSEVVAELDRRGHTAIPVEIAGDDPALGLPEYAAVTDEAIADHEEVVLVAQSMGGFTAPMVDKLDRVAQIVFVNAMIPRPGETPGEWFRAVGQQEAFEAAARADDRAPEFDVDEIFLHDIPEEVKAGMVAADRDPAETPFAQPCTFERWPDVPLHVVVGADDRLFPADLQVREAQRRLGVGVTLLPGGHLIAKSRPVELAEQILASVASSSGTAPRAGAKR